ncbi:collagen-binding domain-containing protein [Lactiplantibacillus brownii]|uniref:collagen-binding domain-containing protein n=1 Tax=Lactiplantibacillus brownii TaxID=3069269 RepID=UPI0038B3E75D
MTTRESKSQWLDLTRTLILIMTTLAILGCFALQTPAVALADTVEQTLTESTTPSEDRSASEPATSDTDADTEATTTFETDSTENSPTTDDQAQTTFSDTAEIESDATSDVFDAIPSGGNVYEDHPGLVNILGIASQFHIFAYEAELRAHTAGNLAVARLNGLVDFGTTNKLELLDRDITYIQQIIKIANSSFVSAGSTRCNKVIFGEGITIDVSDRNQPIVADTTIAHLVADEVYQDQPGETYIDFDAEFAKLTETSLNLSRQVSNASYATADFKDENQRTIDVTDMTPNEAGQIIINLDADVLAKDRPLIIKGVSPDANGNTIIFNVETNGQTIYPNNSEIKVTYPDGTVRANKDADAYGDNHLLWNLHANQQPFTGTFDVNARFQGSVLAPRATLIANQNMDGNLIATHVTVSGETHRWDLQDNTDNEHDPKEEEEDVTKPDPEDEDDVVVEPDPEEEDDIVEPDPEDEEDDVIEPDPEEEDDIVEPDPEEEDDVIEPDPEDEDDVVEPDSEDEDIVEESDTTESKSENPDSVEKETVAEPAVTEETAVPIETQTGNETTTDDAKIVTELETELNAALSLPVAQRTTAVKRVLSKIDTAIRQAHVAKAPIRATKLESLRIRGLAALHTGQLPQTDERRTQALTAIGLGLIIAVIATSWEITKRRRRKN